MKIEDNMEYLAALDRLDVIFLAKPGTPEGDEADMLSEAIAAYEEIHHPIKPPTMEGIYRQAIDEAIMGLHGMNNDFPYLVWESRQAYLDATIAGINDTLSLLK